MKTVSATDEAVRLDIWLWAARFFKTRALAKQAIENGRVLINDERAKPARAVRLGDRLAVTRANETFHVTVAGLSDVRGPASVAQRLYGESEESRLARENARAVAAAERAGFSPPQTKPDKRARRLIRALGDIDAT